MCLHSRVFTWRTRSPEGRVLGPIYYNHNQESPNSIGNCQGSDSTQFPKMPPSGKAARSDFCERRDRREDVATTSSPGTFKVVGFSTHTRQAGEDSSTTAKHIGYSKHHWLRVIPGFPRVCDTTYLQPSEGCSITASSTISKVSSSCHTCKLDTRSQD